MQSLQGTPSTFNITIHQKICESIVSHGEEKESYRKTIISEEARLRKELAAEYGEGVVDWRIQFAEAFANKRGGFDMVLANPPYVRQELIKDLKSSLKEAYPDVYSGTADLYCYFYARGLQLLRRGGMLVFISSNKWFRANYGKNLRTHIAAACRVVSITDFGDLPVFENAMAYAMIFVAQKSLNKGSLLFTRVKTLGPPYPDVREIISREGQVLPESTVTESDWKLTSVGTANRMQTMRDRGISLQEYVQWNICYGVKTGLNDAFVIDEATRSRLVAEDKNSTQLIKPLVMGRDIRRWAIEYEERWLIFTRRGVDFRSYPSIHKHLSQWRKQLEPKPPGWDNSKKWPGRKPGSYKWYEIQDEVAYFAQFEQPKIVFPDIAKEPRFAFDERRTYLGNTAYIIPVNDLYLLAVLNSQCVEDYYTELSAQVRGGYLRFIRQYVEQIPIPQASDTDRGAIGALTKKCLDAKGVDCEAWEREIDERVSALFGL